jgi:hypothetical protein
MGGTSYSHDDYADRARLRAAAHIPDFAHDAAIRSRKVAPTAHEILDPKTFKAEPGTGFLGRVARDSAAHPEAVPIVVALDVTGSNHAVAVTVHRRLPELMNLLIREGYCPHPAIAVWGIGDVLCDRVPLQVSEFESGSTELDAAIQALYLEGGGGGQDPPTESYDLAIYCGARLTAHDHHDKRQQKGFFFMIGDEHCRPKVVADHVKQVFGRGPEADIPTKTLLAELQERYHVFFVLARTSNHFDNPSVRDHWRKMLGESLLILDDPEAICALIGAQVGACAGLLDAEDAEASLTRAGIAAGLAQSASRALVPVGAASGPPVKLTDSGAPSGLARL